MSYLMMGGRELSDISALMNAPNLSSINMTGPKVVELDILVACPKMPSITPSHSASEEQVAKLKEKLPKANIRVAKKPS